MKDDLELSPDDSHPKARAALSAPFFWDLADDDSPFGNETGAETLAAYRDHRDENPKGDPLAFLDALLARWEVASAHWDIADAASVEEVGGEDEFGLLTRDEAVIALAFAQIVEEGRVHHEVRRRALLALERQALPALLHGWGGRMKERAARVEAMRAVLGQRWD